MTLSFWFWIIAILPLIFGGWDWFKGGSRPPLVASALYILVLILGYRVFGSPIRD